jgi:integrase
MFNEIQKQEYIDFESTNESALKRYFARIAPKEEEYQKDIVDMDLDEAMDTLKSLKVRREESRGHLLSLIRGYDNWAKLNGKSKNVHVISRIPPEAIGTDDVYLETMIGSPEHLDKIFDDALDYENYENKSKSHELLFRLLYEGMTLEEVQSLKKSDIDYDERKVKTIHGTDFIVSDYISRLWKECAVMTYYERKNSRSASAKSTNVNEYSKYELNDSRYLFRTIVGTKSHTDVMMTLDSLRKMILNVFLACEKKTVPARNINYSGIFYKLYMLEREGNSITPEIIADYFRISYNEESNMPTITRKWRIDYEDWKIAFGHMQHQVPE